MLPKLQEHPTGCLPEKCESPIQYGEGWQAWTAYLDTYQHIPLERTAQFFEDLTGHRPSEKTLLSSLEKLSGRLEPIEESIKHELMESPVVHADETSMRTEAGKRWLHSISNTYYTLYHVDEKRGKEAFDQFDFLPSYKGIVVHDFWASYFHEDYKVSHALCGAHLLRECQGIIDYDKHKWASEMQALLREALSVKRQALQSGIPIPLKEIRAIETRYDDILERGSAEWRILPPEKKPGERGKVRKPKATNLAERFCLYKADILRFLMDERVPFDNNQAEQDIRMMKVKTKVSGSFRTEQGAIRFARIRGFISTMRKQGRNLLESITLVNQGKFSL